MSASPRNQQCSCGSGKKTKKCCDSIEGQRRRADQQEIARLEAQRVADEKRAAEHAELSKRAAPLAEAICDSMRRNPFRRSSPEMHLASIGVVLGAIYGTGGARR